jgi:hypothetical protein
LRGKYEEDFRAAIQEALRSLSVDDRMLLRMHHRDGLSATELASILRASRATAHRRLQAAREELQRRVRELLKSRLNVGPAELDGVLRLYSSRIVPVLTAEIRKGLTGTP